MIPARGFAAKAPNAPLEPWQFERRDPGPNDVRIDILYCGVCHSDLHQIRNEWFPGIFPMVPGHEIVGKVSGIGSNVRKFATGDLAAVGCLVNSCRTCEHCRDGLEQYCLKGAVGTYNSRDTDGSPTYGGYSSNIVVHEDFVLKLDAAIPLPNAAPLLCAGITTYSPLRHWRVGEGHRLAVLGLGGLGHMAVKFGVAFGAEVTVLSSSPGKEPDAKRLGAHHFAVVSGKSRDRSLKGYFHFILDTVSAPHDFKTYLSMLRLDGTMICVGAPPQPNQIPAMSLINARRSVAGSNIGGIAETQEMLDFCAAGNIACDVEVIDIRYIHQAYDRMLKGDVRYRFVIDMATL